MTDPIPNSSPSQPPMYLALTGGGTAGHVWPHFALFSHPESPLLLKIQRNELRVLYFGSQEGMERDLVTSQEPNWMYFPLATGKLRRYFSWKNFTDPFRVVFGFFQACVILLKYKPKVLFSKGGFVSAPVVWAAALCRVPIVIHESDFSPALTTKLSLPFAQNALCAFTGTLPLLGSHPDKRALGLPLRHSLFKGTKEAAQAFFKFPNPHQKTLLIFGGSLGALGLNEKLKPYLPLWCHKWNVIHVVGKGKSIPFQHPNYRSYEFLQKEMALAYALADGAISRAGASSLFELREARIPMLLVPLATGASRGDQIENAQEFKSKGWAMVWEEVKIPFSGKIEDSPFHRAVEELLTQKDLESSDFASASLAELIPEPASLSVAKLITSYLI